MDISHERELHRYTIALGDFGESLELIRCCVEHQDGSLEFSALVKTAIIAYARPFSQNERSSNSEAIASLEIKWFREINEQEKEFHEFLVTARNKTIAHAEFSEFPTRLDKENGVISSHRPLFNLGRIDLDRFKNLTEKLLDQCVNKRADYTISARNKFNVHD